MRVATDAFKTSPVKSLEVLTGTKPLEDSCNEKLANYVVRVLSYHVNPFINFLLSGVQSPEYDESFDTKFRQLSVANRCRRAYIEYEIDSSDIWEEKPPRFPPWKT